MQSRSLAASNGTDSQRPRACNWRSIDSACSSGAAEIKASPFCATAAERSPGPRAAHVCPWSVPNFVRSTRRITPPTSRALWPRLTVTITFISHAAASRPSVPPDRAHARSHTSTRLSLSLSLSLSLPPSLSLSLSVFLSLLSLSATSASSDSPARSRGASVAGSRQASSEERYAEPKWGSGRRGTREAGPLKAQWAKVKSF